MRVGAVLPEAGDRAIDEARVVLRQALVVEAEFGEPAGLEVLDHDIGARRELVHDALAVFGLEVDRDRALAAIARMIIRGRHLAAVRALDERRTPAARVVARAGALDLHHVGAEVGEDLARPRPGQDARKLENADTGKRSGHGQSPVWLMHAEACDGGLVYVNAEARSIGQRDRAVDDAQKRPKPRAYRSGARPLRRAVAGSPSSANTCSCGSVGCIAAAVPSEDGELNTFQVVAVEVAA